MVERTNFGKIPEICALPNMVDIQVASYDDFLQVEVVKSKRKAVGLQAVFLEVFPITSTDGQYRVDFINYTLEKPKYTIEECRRLAMTYSSPLKIKIRLKGPKVSKEQDVYLGDLPLMTITGTFIVNGDERVVVSQLHRSPGVSFEEERHLTGKRLFSARLIPYRGAWLEFEFDAGDVLHAHIDRRRKFVASVVLRAFGYSNDEDIIDAICGLEEVQITNHLQYEKYIGRTLASDTKDENGNVVGLSKTKITKDLAARLEETHVKKFLLLKVEVPEIINTLAKDYTKSKDDALIDIYRKLRPGDPANLESAQLLLNRLFFDQKRYDLSAVGRFILNRKLNMDVDLSVRVLTPETVIAAIKSLIALKNGEGKTDDIDHLGNRRVKTVGELVQNQFRIGLARLERSIREKMAIYDLENIMPHNLVNSKLVSSVVKDFFARSQLSQFMDQTNPLAELTHKRRVSALGPGGLSRERAGFEVRDVHYSHYGRICPIETPEGPNIGLIASLSTYTKVNEFGFLETPYRKVEKGKALYKIDYLSADLEDKYIIAQANAPLDKSGKFVEETVLSRFKGDFPKVEPSKISYMDVSPRQLVSIAASLIPFLEHDDANRALMGSNMQRQAVPLLFTESPIVGTGMEGAIAKDSGVAPIARNSGVVTKVDSTKIVVGSTVYNLKKFARSNANTSVNQRPIVKIGQKVKVGDVIADGPATQNGELALGRNLLVAFMPWRGYNFEDAIILSEKLVSDDMFTSVHIEEFEIEARETRLGNEEITRDIPNVSEEALMNLDEGGIIRLGAEVGPGDILAGKITPKSETELTPEEKLLRAIFGEKAGDVRDTSLTVPPGIEGVVVDVRIFSRKGSTHKTKEEMTKELKQVDEIRKFYQNQIKLLKEEKLVKLTKGLTGKKAVLSFLDDETQKVIVAQGKTIKKSDIKNLLKSDLIGTKLLENPIEDDELKRVLKILDDQMEELFYDQEREIEKIKRGDELPPGVLKKVTVYVASKRKVQVGDKVAGRHGNKGVVAKILPQEDMPYMDDGTPVEIILNPLGVPSRMNVGQILETHLGWAGKVLGLKFSTPVFDGASEREVKDMLKKAGLPEDSKVTLHDGLTGDVFEQKVTVGYIYMLKLVHLVDDKIHSRSIGPYSLVTQQPLGGKAQFGGQRFGEMEVWALEAYGAAYTLQELLTVKSDDVVGRTRIYEAIVKGEDSFRPGTPESFNVLVKELQSLGLDVKLEKKK